MMRQILCISWFLLLTGCAAEFEVSREADAVIYPELQRFNIEFKHNDLTAAQQQVTDIIADLLPAAADTQWMIYYRLKRDMNIAKRAVKQLKGAGVIPAQITQQLEPLLNADIVLEVRQYHLITTTCQRYSFDDNRNGCYVNALRLQQVVSPSRLINAVKE